MPIIDVASVADHDEPGHTSMPIASASSASSEQTTVLMGQSTDTNLASRIHQLRKGQNKLREDRQKIARELKKALRKSRRLKERARQLSEDDMVQILVMKRSKQSVNSKKSVALGIDLSGTLEAGIMCAARVQDLELSGPSKDTRPCPEDDEVVGAEDMLGAL
jgi:hypothetical protein